MERRRFTREFKLEAVRLIRDRGVSYVQASADLKVHATQLRSWVKEFADDPQHAFPGPGQMKPEQLEIARLKREVIKLKAERDILKKPWWIQAMSATLSANLAAGVMKPSVFLGRVLSLSATASRSALALGGTATGL